MASQVVVVGDAVLDVHVSPAEPMRPGSDVPAAIRLGPGGQGANLAVRLARRGVDVRLRCALGADAAGDFVRSALGDDGVSLDALDALVTGSVVVLVDPDGGRTMLSQRVALLGAPLVRSETGWLVVSGYALLEASAPQLSVQEWPGLRAVIGCALDEAAVEPWRTALRVLSPSLLVLNDDEARVLTGGAADPAVALADAFDAVVVVTAANGASAALGDERVSVIRDPVTALDTTGAGDAFAAGLIAELLHVPWPPPRDALERALEAAASSATAVTLVPGAQTRVDGER